MRLCNNFFLEYNEKLLYNHACITCCESERILSFVQMRAWSHRAAQTTGAPCCARPEQTRERSTSVVRAPLDLSMDRLEVPRSTMSGD